MILVPPFPGGATIRSASAINQIPSALRLGNPPKETLNHLLGFRLAGLLHYQLADSGTPGTGRFMVYKHPNSTTLALVVRVTETGGTSGDTITFKVGSGSTMAATIYGTGEYVIFASWGAGDSGFQEVVYSTSSNVKIDAAIVFDVPRGTLDSGVEGGVSPLSGFNEGEVIAASDIATFHSGQLTQRNHHRHHAVTWAMMEVFTTTSSLIFDAPNIDGYTVTFKVAGKKYKDADTTRKYRAYIYSKTDKATYDLRVSVDGTNYDLTGLSNTSFAWQSIDDIKLSTSGSTIQFGAKSGGGTVSIAGFSLVERDT